MSQYETIDSAGAPIKAWIKDVPIEDAAREQLRNIVSLPFIYRHVAVMPDVHLGKGASVGEVIATQGAIVPAAVGVDIGCGMCAARTNLRAEHLPDNLAAVRAAIEAVVPVGNASHKAAPRAVEARWYAAFLPRGLVEQIPQQPIVATD
ncbi:MAG TPA: RtcB family protein [Stellaceae bacterium]|nr:RtcB family protein [Stellaceae bacterium]